MQTKLLEVRDRETFIAVFCVNMQPQSWEPPVQSTSDRANRIRERRYLLRRCGYGEDGPTIAMGRLDANGQPWNADPYHWCDRTMQTAHVFIQERWDELEDGDVVDVEFILGLTEAPKISERVSCPA